MLANTSQVLLRNASLFTSGEWLLANAPADNVFSELRDVALTGFHQFFDVYQHAVKGPASHQHIFSHIYDQEKMFDGVVIYLPKSKDHARMLLANLTSAIKPGGQLLLVGENKGGIKSAKKLLEPFSTCINKVDSARHCSLFCAQIETPAKAFKLQDWQKQFSINAAGIQIELVSLPGVFGHGVLDTGTELLLNNLGKVPDGRILDFACGDGVIGCVLGKLNPAIDLVMSDVSALAIYCATKSLELNQVKAKVVASDGLRELQGKFAAIYSNPPFHTGIETDYSIVEQFISQLKQTLHPGGQLLLVANRFLKYPDALQAQLRQVQTKAQTSKFNLYRGFA